MSGYNGWTNYETWNVNLWIDNEQGSQEYWQERAQEILNDEEGNKEKAAYTLSKALQEEHKENTPTVTGVYADLLNASLSEVNWYEIAEHHLNDLTYES